MNTAAAKRTRGSFVGVMVFALALSLARPDAAFSLAGWPVGGEFIQRAPALLANGGRLVSVAEEPPGEGTYFVVEPSRQQLVELASLADSGDLRVAIDASSG